MKKVAIRNIEKVSINEFKILKIRDNNRSTYRIPLWFFTQKQKEELSTLLERKIVK